MVRRRAGLAAIAMALVGATLVGGCAQIASVPLALADSLTVVSWVSTAVSGKGLGEHALDFVTGKDCRFLDAALRADRDLCEPPGSPATEDDFEGLAGLFDRDKVAVSATAPPQLQPASLQPASLQPASLQPASLQPASLQPASLQPASLQPASLQAVEEIWPQAR